MNSVNKNMDDAHFKISNHLNGLRVIEWQLTHPAGSWSDHTFPVADRRKPCCLKAGDPVHSFWLRKNYLVNTNAWSHARISPKRVTRIESLPLQGMLHCLLIVGSHHNISSSAECNLVQHIVQAPFCEHTDVNIIRCSASLNKEDTRL